jgi:phosphate transport system permease protein
MENARYAARRRNNAAAKGFSYAATAFGLGWLVLILGALLWHGFGGLSPAVFTQMTPPPGASGGLLNPIIGSLILTGLAVGIGTPIGILAGTYMAEYGRYSQLSSLVRFINDGPFLRSGWRRRACGHRHSGRGAHDRGHADAGSQRLA